MSNLSRDLNNIRKKDTYIKETRKKAQLGLYLSPNTPLSYNGFSDFVYTAVRGIGKTVIGLETAIILKNKYGWDNVKCYYFRTNANSIQALLTPEKSVDPYLSNKYKFEVETKRNECWTQYGKLYEAYPLVSAASIGKGVNLYDCNWFNPEKMNGKKHFIVTIWDEFMLDEGVGKKSVGDPVKQYMIYREAIFRDAERLPYNAVYNFFLANNVSECANVTGQLFNYIPNPNNHNIVKLTRKRAIFWNVPVTEEKKEKIKKSYNSAIIRDDDPNYSNVVRDFTLIKPKKTRIYKITDVIKFSKLKQDWFLVYDNKYIQHFPSPKKKKDGSYKGEVNIPKNACSIGMYRNIDEVYNLDLVQNVLSINDIRGYMFTDIISMAIFQARMKEFRSK